MLTDVIAALATPPGRSAVALLRVSGRDAFSIAARVLNPFTADPPRNARRSRAHHASGETLDDVLYLTYAAPASYTGEPVVEISTHGGLLAPVEVLEALLAAGARLAHPGEFTRRALSNGKLDLLQAEAIGDLVDATAPAQRRAALTQLDRGLSERLNVLREEVLALEALVCYDIDFPEEDHGPVSPERIDGAIAALERSLDGLLATAAEGERLREGALAVIAGRPNAGKSSLFNALLGYDRAIVTEQPGTTRDAIEAPAVCGGFPFRLVDTAGLHVTTDRIEQMGIEVSRRYLAAADLVLFCVEAGRPLELDELEFLRSSAVPALVVRTKGDGAPVGAGVDGEIIVSARTGVGLDVLRGALAAASFTHLSSQGAVDVALTRARHRVAVGQAHAEIVAFGEARRAGIETLVAAAHLHAAAAALRDVIGLVSSEDVLERVFATFCVGK